MIEAPHRTSESPIAADLGVSRVPPNLDGTIPVFAALAAAVAWIGFVSLSFAVQPPPDPTTAPGVVAEVMSLLFTGALLAAIAGLGTRRRWGLVASVGGGLVMIAASIFCYADGHTGSWIAIQLAAGIGLAATSWGLLRVS